MEFSELQQIVESNARAIAALADSTSVLSEEVRMTQRQMRDILRRIDNNSNDLREIQADIRELILENQRILRHLESRS